MSKKDSLTGGGSWAEFSVQPRELIVPRTRVDSEDEIPTLPDLDELQDALEKEADAAAAPRVPEKWIQPDSGTYAELEAEDAQLGDVSLASLLSHVRSIASSTTTEADNVWTVATLLAELSSDAQVK